MHKTQCLHIRRWKIQGITGDVTSHVSPETRSDQNHGLPPLLAVSDDAVSQRWSRSTGHHCNRVIIYILAGYSLGSIGPNQNNDR